MPETSLISLARTPREKREMVDVSPRPENVEDYGWGLTISLGPSEMRKLGLAKDGVDTGSVIALLAKGIVIVSSVESINNSTERSIVIQLQEMKVVADADEQPDAAVAIYGGKEAK